MPHNVFAFFADVEPLPDVTVDPDVSDGGYVYCYVSAVDESQATEKLRLDLKRHGLQLDNVQWCVKHDVSESAYRIGIRGFLNPQRAL